MANDSFYVGDDVLGDDVLGDDDIEGMDDVELGRRARRIARKARRQGMVVMPRSTAQQLRQAQQQQAVSQALATGRPVTIDGKLAPSGQRIEVLPLGSTTLGALATDTAQLQVNNQRGFQAVRLVLQAADSTTGANFLFAVGVSDVRIGAHNLYSAPGVVAPATMFSADAWGTDLMTVPLGQGGVVSLSLSKLTVTANALVVSAGLVGFGA